MMNWDGLVMDLHGFAMQLETAAGIPHGTYCTTFLFSTWMHLSGKRQG
jgi:hypothetical protein